MGTPQEPKRTASENGRAPSSPRSGLTGKLGYALVALIAIFVTYRSYKLDHNLLDLNSMPMVNNKNCHVYEEIGPAEDVIMDPTNGILYVAAGRKADRVEYYPPFGAINKSLNKSAFHDYIATFDPDTKKVTKLTFEGFEGHDFVGHGVSLIPAEDGESNYVFVVNHERTGSVVSVFQHKRGASTIQYLHEFKSPGLYTPNSVAAISPYEIYSTNDHYFPSGTLRTLENALLPIGSTNVQRCTFDPKTRKTSCKAAVTKLGSANGIEYLRERDEIVFLQSTVGVATFVPRDPSTGALDLTKKRVTNLGGALDNVRRVPGTNDIIAMAFPDIGAILSQMHDIKGYKANVPNMVFFLKESENYSEPHVLFHDDGSQLSFTTGATVIPRRGEIAIGSVLNHGLMICKIDEY